MRLLLKWCFSDYRRYWFKTACTAIGLVLSVALFLVIELYSQLLQPSASTFSMIGQSPYRLINSSGFISHDQIQLLMDEGLISEIQPYSERRDKLIIDSMSYTATVIGMDIHQFYSRLSSLSMDQFRPTMVDPFNLNQAIVLMPDGDIKQGAVRSLMTGRMVEVVQLPVPGVPSPILIMDIALFQSIYQPYDSVDSILLSATNIPIDEIESITRQSPNLAIQSVVSDLESRSKWTNSLRYNLRFLSLIAMVVSVGLLVQFFRFIGYQRLSQVDVLYQLGVSRRTLAIVIGIECSLIAGCVWLVSGVVGYGIAWLGLTVFNQTISTFYLQLAQSSLVITPVIIGQMTLVVGGALVIAYISILRQLLAISRTMSRRWMTGVGVAGIAAAIWGLQWPLSVSGLMLTGGGLITGFLCLSWGLTLYGVQWLGRIKHPRLLVLKMAQTSFRNDPVSYGVIAFVIALALSLILCMGIFVHSFRTSVYHWLDTVIQYDIYIQHKANDIQFPVAVPDSVVQAIESTIPSSMIHSISRLPIVWKGISSQLQLLDDDDDRMVIYKSGPYRHPTDVNVDVSESFAAKHGLSVGDRIQLEGVLADPVHISSIVYDYTSEFGVVTMSRSIVESVQGPLPIHGIAIDWQGAGSSTVIDNLLEALSKRGDILIQSNQSLRDQSIDIFDETFTFTWFMVGLIGSIALICIANVLTIISIDRRHELMQLWIIGLNGHRLRHILTVHMMTVVWFSMAMAIGLGFLLYYFLVYGIQLPTFHWSIFLDVPWQFIFVICSGFLFVTWVCAGLFSRVTFSTMASQLREGYGD